ncbi:hypothetical protein EVJ32_05135 [Exiguobacterium sp. SH5S4]|uniref:hypothetical protein n=1 Tax=Exiguobacterium sp. SH5S4 TaxID=2510961 RepID=UPI00103E81B1|nr:hypothetical protein [Exiguobacterium sp. SH5S4]TCI26762.1 hypothetical protein EVJ32_05135 [Exiguobacterium sp. SH5S4]
MASQLTNPLLYQTREGSLEDPYVDKIETIKLVGGKAVLEEVPVKEFGVIVDGYTEKATNTPEGTRFYVDYTNGVLYFEPSLVDTVTVRYKGRGVVKIPAERIYYGDAENNESVGVTLSHIAALGARLDEDIEMTNEATAAASTQATFAQTQGEFALNQGDYAKSMGLEAKGSAEAAVLSANNARDLALEKAQRADEAALSAVVNWLNPVSEFAGISTTYPNPEHGDQVQTQDDGNVYRYHFDKWISHSFSPTHPQNMARRKDRLVGTQGQTVFTTSKAYFTNQDRIDVYVSGVKQSSGVDFNETSPTKVTLINGVNAGDVVELVYFKTTEAQALELIEQTEAAEAATLAANTAANSSTSATQAAMDAAESTKFTWQNPVNTFSNIATTYPSPQKGWAVMVRNTGQVYRYDGSAWLERIDLSVILMEAVSELVDTSDINGGMFGEVVTGSYINGGTF